MLINIKYLIFIFKCSKAFKKHIKKTRSYVYICQLKMFENYNTTYIVQ